MSCCSSDTQVMQKKEKRKKRRKKKRPIIRIVMYATHTESFAMAGVYSKLLIK